MSLLHPFTVVEVIRDSVTDPMLASAFPLFLFAFFNDIIGIFPFALYLAGQLVFYPGTFDTAMLAKLLVFVAVPVGIGSAAGSIPLYLVAYYGGKPLIVKYEKGFFKKFLRFSWHDVEKVNTYFKGVWYDEVIFLALRCVPVLPSFPLDVAAGTLRMPFMPFFVLTAVGSIIRMALTLGAFAASLHGLSQF
jgi:membrane protein DedA with SNARE-associated domain